MHAHEDFTGGCVCVWKLYSAADKHDMNRDSFSGLLEAQQPRLNISTIQIEQEKKTFRTSVAAVANHFF